jgi:alkanesulfonate monooxygenase SsuD/methylene tetrahydromethanopterin reductase-like flavin-dependent oxidoreductase (luciferase family)
MGVIGRLADGWIPAGGASRIGEHPDLSARIDEAAAAAGRDPGSIRRVLNVAGAITDGARGGEPLEGPTDQWIETLSLWAVEHRVDAFVFWPADVGEQQIERFASEIVPAVRGAIVDHWRRRP